jgi:hypothetical protein
MLCYVFLLFKAEDVCRLRSRGLTYSSCTLQSRGLTYSSRKSRGQPWLQNVSFITTCPFIITIQGGTLINLQICEQKNMKTLVSKFEHMKYIQHSASSYHYCTRPQQGRLVSLCRGGSASCPCQTALTNGATVGAADQLSLQIDL